MLASNKEDKLLYPDDHLIWCPKVDSGPRKPSGFRQSCSMSLIPSIMSSLPLKMSFKEKSATFEPVYYAKYQEILQDFVVNVIKRP